jgi:hypothetical protein
MLLPAGPLALWGAWILSVSVPQGEWRTSLLGGVALVTSGGLLFLKAWARPLAFLIAGALVVNWFYGAAQVILRGWPYTDWFGTMLSLVPGAFFLIVCGGEVWVVHKQYRRRARET